MGCDGCPDLNAPWFDVTYNAYKAYVVGEIQKPVYPQIIWLVYW